jgi:hypothetical protein
MSMTKSICTVIVFVGFGCTATAASPTEETCQEGAAVVVEETFSGGGNQGAWSISSLGIIRPQGGSEGAYLHAPGLDTFAPMAQTRRGVPSVFTGDYRAHGVTALSVDLSTFAVSSTAEERPLSLMLVSDAGTPGDMADDVFVYYVGADNIPFPEEGWVRYLFAVPSHSATLPSPRSQVEGEPGWVAARGDVFTPAPDPDAAWNLVMTDVDQVIFWFHDPRYFAMLQNWDVGVDNPAITTCAP